MTYSYGAGPAGPQAVTGVDLNVGDDLTFTYDLRGNMATKAKSGVVSHIYTFDVENRLASVYTGYQTMSFAYDADGQRVMTTRHDGTIVYTPFLDYEMEDPPGSGANTVRTTYRLAGQIVAVQTKVGANPGTYYYTYTDHLGNVVVLSYTGGTPFYSSLARYDPFGNYRTTPVTTTNPAITSHGFTGHQHNNTGLYPTQNVGLIYMNARYYLPEVGRFISPDSIVPEPENPQSYNRYSYVLNSPLSYTDPTGHLNQQEIHDYFGFDTYDEMLLAGWDSDLLDMLWNKDVSWGNIFDYNEGEGYAILALFETGETGSGSYEGGFYGLTGEWRGKRVDHSLFSKVNDDGLAIENMEKRYYGNWDELPVFYPDDLSGIPELVAANYVNVLTVDTIGTGASIIGGAAVVGACIVGEPCGAALTATFFSTLGAASTLTGFASAVYAISSPEITLPDVYPIIMPPPWNIFPYPQQIHFTSPGGAYR